MENERKDIFQLEKELNLLNQEDPQNFIIYYESNLSSIDGIEVKKDSEHYDFKLRLLYKYGLCLTSSGEYTKSAAVLGNALIMYESNLKNNTEDGGRMISEENLLWNYGTSLWETNQAEQSKIVFERLVKDYPNNDKYKKWLNGLVDEQLSKISRPLWIIGGIWLVCELTIFKNLDSGAQFWLTMVGALLLLTLLGFELRGYLMKKKNKRKPNKK